MRENFEPGSFDTITTTLISNYVPVRVVANEILPKARHKQIRLIAQ